MKKFVLFFSVSFLLFLLIADTARRNFHHSSLNRGREIYEAYCVSCHAFAGGEEDEIGPGLKGSSYVSGSKQKLIRIILRGSDELPSNTVRPWSSPMPAMKHLSDQQIADVLTFVRIEFGKSSSAVSTTEVRNERARLKEN